MHAGLETMHMVCCMRAIADACIKRPISCQKKQVSNTNKGQKTLLESDIASSLHLCKRCRRCHRSSNSNKRSCSPVLPKGSNLGCGDSRERHHPISCTAS